MGSYFAKMIESVMSRFSKDSRVILLGLDAAGKTTILYRLNLGENVVTLPTVGFNVETITYKNVNFTVWDVGGQDKIRGLWKHYYQGTDALIWCVDSSDKERTHLARDELHRVLSDDLLQNVKVLVFANKMDLPGAMNPTELADGLQLRKLSQKDWYVQQCCGTNGEGLYEGLDHLATMLENRNTN